MTVHRLVAISAGLGNPSSSALLSDRLGSAVIGSLEASGDEATLTTVELRDLAHDVTNAMLTGFAAPRLQAVIDDLRSADGMIAVSPVFSSSISGLFKSFLDVLEPSTLAGVPVLLGATGGTARHSLALEFGIRPVLTYLHADVARTAVFAATEDWGANDTALPERIERAAAEFADQLRRAAPREAADEFALPPGFDPTGA